MGVIDSTKHEKDIRAGELEVGIVSEITLSGRCLIINSTPPYIE